MRSKTGGGTFPEEKKVPIEKQTGQLAEFFSFLASGSEHATISWTRTADGATVFLRVIRKSLEKVRPKPNSGHISDWINESEIWCSQFSIRPLILLCKAIEDPRNTRIVEQSFSDLQNEIQSYIPLFRKHDFSPLNIWLQNLADKLGIKGNVQFIPNAAIFRAIQVQLKCLIFYRTSAKKLIEEAISGNRDAGLKLIRADYLFFSDPCTTGVISRAALENDEIFFSSLKTALNITEKDLVRIGIYLFSAVGSKRRKAEIRNVLDPNWTKFKIGKHSGDAFEQFVKRARTDMKRLSDHAMHSNCDTHAESESEPR